jgi:hypothetical protein
MVRNPMQTFDSEFNKLFNHSRSDTSEAINKTQCKAETRMHDYKINNLCVCYYILCKQWKINLLGFRFMYVGL